VSRLELISPTLIAQRSRSLLAALELPSGEQQRRAGGARLEPHEIATVERIEAVINVAPVTHEPMLVSEILRAGLFLCRDRLDKPFDGGRVKLLRPARSVR
jgi:hypothetical protein